MKHPNNTALTVYAKRLDKSWHIEYATSDVKKIGFLLKYRGDVHFEVLPLSSPEVVVHDQLMEHGFSSSELFHSTKEMHVPEHTHTDIEARWIIFGNATFFIRMEAELPQNERVYRLDVTPGDFIILPARIKHWFQSNADLVAYRLYSGDTCWAADETNSGIEQEIENAVN